MINSYTRKGKKIYACFVDFSKAYDSVWRDGLLYKFIEIILRVFNLILDKSQFPEIWKIGYIVPIFKGEDSFDPSNYRGIAITSCLGKLFTLILNERSVAFLEKRKIFKT